MKKILTLLLALWMLTGCVAMAAGNQLVVGSTTAMSGAFFTDLFGSNTADIDVRALLHGYNLMSWDRNRHVPDQRQRGRGHGRLQGRAE